MSPQEFDEWWEYCEPIVAFQLKGSIARYPSIAMFREWLPAKVLGQVRTRSRHLLLQDGKYLAGRLQFLRWLSVVSRRELMQTLLRTEPVEVALAAIGEKAARVLRLVYADLFTMAEVAKTLDLRMKDEVEYDTQAAWQQTREAYQQLCKELARRGGAGSGDMTVYPAPPGIVEFQRQPKN